jgi:ankyrin
LGQLDQAKKLIELGSDGWALRLAAQQGHLDVVTLLLDRGAKINMQDTEVLSPLHLAAGLGRKDDKGQNLLDEEGLTPLHLAARLGAKPASAPLVPASSVVGDKLKERSAKKAYPDRPSAPGKPKA